MNAEFINALEQIEKEKGIEKAVLFEAIEAALISGYKRNFGSLQNVRVAMDRQNGEVSVWAQKTVVATLEDARQEITLEEARRLDPNYKIGDIVEEKVTPRDFGRISAQTAKQVVVQRIREAERGHVYDAFSNREGDVVTGVVSRMDRSGIMVDLGKAEAVLAPSEQIPGEVFQVRDRVKAYVVEVRRSTKGPQIHLSRTHPGLLRRLLELEVPEIHEGVVELQAVVREPGARAKVAVFSRQEDVDPIGATVGPKGQRVQSIVHELRGEKLDVIRYDKDPAVYIANALSPAKVLMVEIDDEKHMGKVVVPEYQLSLAIGKEGQNARLAAKLTGWKVDIKPGSDQ